MKLIIWVMMGFGVSLLLTRLYMCVTGSYNGLMGTLASFLGLTVALVFSLFWMLLHWPHRSRFWTLPPVIYVVVFVVGFLYVPPLGAVIRDHRFRTQLPLYTQIVNDVKHRQVKWQESQIGFYRPVEVQNLPPNISKIWASPCVGDEVKVMFFLGHRPLTSAGFLYKPHSCPNESGSYYHEQPLGGDWYFFEN